MEVTVNFWFNYKKLLLHRDKPFGDNKNQFTLVTRSQYKWHNYIRSLGDEIFSA